MEVLFRTRVEEEDGLLAELKRRLCMRAGVADKLPRLACGDETGFHLAPSVLPFASKALLPTLESLQ